MEREQKGERKVEVGNGKKRKNRRKESRREQWKEERKNNRENGKDKQEYVKMRDEGIEREEI